MSELTLSLSFLPVYPTCPCLVLKRALAIAVARPTHMIPRLVVGSLINKVLSSSEDSCGSLVTEAVEFLTNQLSESLGNLPENFDIQQPDDYEKYKEFIEKKGLTQKLRYYYDDAIHSIKAFGNAGAPQTLKTLQTAFKSHRLQTEGRAAVMYALQSMSRRIPEAVSFLFHY
jgi:hypothetical protein